MMHERVYISDKGHLKPAFAALWGAIASWLWWLQVPFSVSASPPKSLCHDEQTRNRSFHSW